MLLLQKDTHTYTRNKNIWRTHFYQCKWNCRSNYLGLDQFIGMEWKSRVCLCVYKCGAAMFRVTCGQMISNELCKSPQSYTDRQWAMLTTPSQWNYMNIFIGQQKAKESQKRAYSISMKASSFILMTRKADFWILMFFHRDALYYWVGSFCRFSWSGGRLSWRLVEVWPNRHLCVIMTMFVSFFSPLFSSTVPPLCRCDTDVEGWGRSRRR